MGRSFSKVFKKTKSPRSPKGFIRIPIRRFETMHSYPRLKVLRGIKKIRRSNLAKSVER